MTKEELELKVERLRTEMHEAPMNPVFQNHTGYRFLGAHSMAWARASRDWADAKKELSTLS